MRAIERGEVSILYQPQLFLETGQAAGAEALVRWEHPEKGVIPPEHFIPLAEESGAILDLGRWVLEQACRQAARWQRSLPGLKVGVNVSVLQLEHPGFPDTLEEVLRATGVAPEGIVLEITESSLLEHEHQATEALWRIRGSGVRLAVDDFGTGYSSLSYLDRFPVDYIKIDRSLVQRLETNGERTASLLEALVVFAHSLKMRVVAEGLETAAQLETLRGMRCDVGQGLLFSGPAPAAEAEAFLRQRLRPRSP
ncbi:Oxygen sensor protein DosP [Rubrobacter xylanophilus DSM 9941]|uniref:EAL domain-containing protein n=1 Tax=Rubrobacter xylanophilus TaxID=49319 RepID=UPI001C63D90A|nr:EAL domain-containing protein [Rubrobacter xylanophilus]QYJ15252.1 Oxygen sensor protein DosP [Rubrobacter xylanophilus DSM 9941]